MSDKTKGLSSCHLSFLLQSIIKCLYWQKECKLNIRQIHKRFKDIDADVIQELIDEGCIKVDSTGEITITFLLSQYQTFKERREKLSKAGRKGGQSKKEASIKPPLNKDKTTIKHIEENREEEKIKYYRRFAHLKLTIKEFDKLKETYTKQQIDDCLDSIENYAKNRNYKSLYLTVIKWLKKDSENNNENKVGFKFN